MSPEVRRIAVNTGGGDAPGLNAVIRAVVLAALSRGWTVLGIEKSYHGLFEDGGVRELRREDVRAITHLGGTILGTTNRGNPFRWPTADGELIDRSAEVLQRFDELGVDALVAIGGDGSLRIAHQLAELGLPVVGVPKTIDNDVEGTAVTFGFDTAVTIATEAIDRLHSTAEAHERVFVVEVMGRYAGWIALHAGVASTSDVILIPEIPFDIDAVCAKVRKRDAVGRRFAIIVVAEGAKPIGGELVTLGAGLPGREVRLGGIAEQVAAEIAQRTGKNTRSVVLGHLQRGGGPTTFDRMLALRLGAAAVRAIEDRQLDTMVAFDPPTVRPVPLADVVDRMKAVDPASDAVRTARDLGIIFGDEAAEG